MPPTVIFKGLTRGTEKVSIYSMTILRDTKSPKKGAKAAKVVKPNNLMVKIVLPPDILKSISDTSADDDLTSLDNLLNKALESSSTQEQSLLVSLKYKRPEDSHPTPDQSQTQQTQQTQTQAPPTTQTETQQAHQTPQTQPSQAASNTSSINTTNGTTTNDSNTNSFNVKIEKQTPSAVSAQNDGYRTIPPNLISILKSEFGLLNETAEELEMIEKMIFTLRDPLTATKIKLPIKSVMCTHFECFDFENFCLFNHLPYGVKSALRKDLVKKSTELKRQDKKLNQQQDIASLTREFMYQPTFPAFNPLKLSGQANGVGHSQHHFPVYKCPVCNESFFLNQLFISDIFNYFVRTTPLDVDRIELTDMIKYRIVSDDDKGKKEADKEMSADVIILSDESEEEEEEDEGEEEQDEEHEEEEETQEEEGHQNPTLARHPFSPEPTPEIEADPKSATDLSSLISQAKTYRLRPDIIQRLAAEPDNWRTDDLIECFNELKSMPELPIGERVFDVWLDKERELLRQEATEEALFDRIMTGSSPSMDFNTHGYLSDPEETEDEQFVRRLNEDHPSDIDSDGSFVRSYERYLTESQSQPKVPVTSSMPLPPNTIPPNPIPPNTIPPNTIPPNTIPPNPIPTTSSSTNPTPINSIPSSTHPYPHPTTNPLSKSKARSQYPPYLLDTTYNGSGSWEDPVLLDQSYES